MTVIQPAYDATVTLWFLVGRLDAGGPLRHIPVHDSPFSVGRSPRAMLSIASPAVSSTHADIVEFDDGLYVRDKGSTNGTFVNGNRVTAMAKVEDGDILQFGDTTLRLLREGMATVDGTAKTDAYDQALALAQFDRLMSANAIVPHYQPIVNLQSGQAETVAYEVLGRSKVLGLESAGKMFQAARQLNLEKELSSMLRWKGVEISLAFETIPHLFVNTHRSELNTELADSLTRLRDLNGSQSLTLELNEAAASTLDHMKSFRAILNELDIKLAYDDFGAGRDRLLELAECPPDYLKFDMGLIRHIDTAPLDQFRVVEKLVGLARGLNVATIALGIETPQEAETCRCLGFDYAQGYYFGKPSAIRSGRPATATSE